MHLLILYLIMLWQSPMPDAGVFVKSVWFFQVYGDGETNLAENDRPLKMVLAKALAKDRELTLDEVQGMISEDAFKRLAGADNRLSELEISKAVEASIPRTRKSLNPELCKHADFLTTSYDLIEPDHYASLDRLADWIATNWKANETLHVVMTCTGNSRRSILGAAMGNLAASYYGLESVHFHSGGTTPSALNKRTIATLKEIGFQIDPTGDEAERGDPKTPNRKYRIIWGNGLETVEFSKSYAHQSNPQSGFAAILVCSEADAECPVVNGAAVRISMPFLDPKTYDDSAFEVQKYAESRDDIGRTMFAVMANARRKILERESKR